MTFSTLANNPIKYGIEWASSGELHNLQRLSDHPRSIAPINGASIRNNLRSSPLVGFSSFFSFCQALPENVRGTFRAAETRDTDTLLYRCLELAKGFLSASYSLDIIAKFLLVVTSGSAVLTVSPILLALGALCLMIDTIQVCIRLHKIRTFRKQYLFSSTSEQARIVRLFQECASVSHNQTFHEAERRKCLSLARCLGAKTTEQLVQERLPQILQTLAQGEIVSVDIVCLQNIQKTLRLIDQQTIRQYQLVAIRFVAIALCAGALISTFVGWPFALGLACTLLCYATDLINYFLTKYRVDRLDPTLCSQS